MAAGGKLILFFFIFIFIPNPLLPLLSLPPVQELMKMKMKKRRKSPLRRRAELFQPLRKQARSLQFASWTV
jgi:hypothetical protein